MKIYTMAVRTFCRFVLVSSRSEARVFAKFLSDWKRGTSRALHAVFGERIKHDSYFGLDIYI